MSSWRKNRKMRKIARSGSESVRDRGTDPDPQHCPELCYYDHLFWWCWAPPPSPCPTLALVTTLEVEGRLVDAAADSAVGKKISARWDSIVRSFRTSRSPFLVAAATLALVFTLATRPCLRALPPPTRASREMLSFSQRFRVFFYHETSARFRNETFNFIKKHWEKVQ